MKKQTVIVVLFTTLAIVPAFCQSWNQDKPLISVSGSADVKVVPDEIDLNVGVETRDVNLQAAKKQNDDSIAAALNFLKQNDVAGKNIKTDYISIEPVYPDGDGTYVNSSGERVINSDKVERAAKPVFYNVRKSISIKLTDVSHFDYILSGLVTNGVNVVRGIDFRTSELRKYRDNARVMAVKAAKEKADAMAATLGVKAGKPFSISENDWGGWTSWSGEGWGQVFGGAYQNQANASVNGSAAVESDDGTLSAGEISVSATVNVSFLIE